MSTKTKLPTRPRTTASHSKRVTKKHAVKKLPKIVPLVLPAPTSTTIPTVLQAPPLLHRSTGWLIITGFTVVAMFMSGYVVMSQKHFITPVKKPAAQPTTPPPSKFTAIAPLTGLPATPETAARRPWAVVVENFPTVRPQSGLSFADVVFEAPTEGGITRFLALFQSRLPEGRLGPIRSARPYFNDWARTWDAFYSHSGGTASALEALRGGYGAVQDVNEFWHGAAYERDLARQVPHNLFTYAERFMSYARERGWTVTTNLTANFSFGEPASDAPTAATATIPYVPSEYGVQYRYDSMSKTYERLVDGNVQREALTGEPLHITNAVMLVTDITSIPKDPLLRVEVRTLGSGPLTLFTRGRQYAGRWSKLALDSPLTLTTPQGTRLVLAPGNTWISVVDTALVTTVPAAPTLTP